MAAVEKEMNKASRNHDAKFSPKILRPGNPLGKLFDADLDEFSIKLKECGFEGSLSTESSIKD